MIATVISFALFIFYGSYKMVLENSKVELKGAAYRLNEVFENLRLKNRLKAVGIANQISTLPDEMKKKKIFNLKGQVDKLRMNSLIVGKLELNFNPKTEYIIAYYDIEDKTLISLKEDEILNTIISSELFSRVKENNVSCDIFTHKNKIYIVSLAPVFMDNVVAGSVIVVRMIDDQLAYDIRDITSLDVSIFEGDNLIGSTFRQSSPEVLVEIMQSKEKLLLHGKMKGKEGPYFPLNIPSMITVINDLSAEKGVKIAVTTRLAPRFSELRDIQFIVMIVLIGVLLIGLIISFSISRTIYSNINMVVDSLAPAIRGNFSVQIPESRVPSPFDALVRSINKLLFVAREKVAVPARSSTALGDASKEEIKRTFTAEIKVPSVSSKPVSSEFKKADVTPEKVETKGEGLSRPITGEIEVGNVVSQEDVGEMIEDYREEYNPDATMVASLEEIEALEKAKGARQSSDLDEFRKLFDKYIAMKLENGESIDNLNFDNFLEKIKTTKADLIKKGNYKDVRFEVILKNGKVTLKANPIK